MRRTIRFFCLMLIGVSLVSCSPSRYSEKHDSAPEGEFDASLVTDPTPKYERRTRAGNKSPYVVHGKKYYVLTTEKGYREKGIASWYGKKFHGHKTSNGETYDMYKMSAAHRSLPIPSYARVTNLKNKRSVVVRINDRGPFHKNRLIDVSYAAALKLDIVKSGTGKVLVEAIEMPESRQAGIFLQLAAYSELPRARRYAIDLAQHLSTPVFITSVLSNGKQVHRVNAGPYNDASGAEQDRERLQRMKMSEAFIVHR